jgi:hypothetical protein
MMGYNKNIKLKGDEMKVERKKIEGMEREREVSGGFCFLS